MHDGNTDTRNQQQEQDHQKRVREAISRIDNTIVVMSGKGGVGKTTVAANLATGLAERGFRVGLLDADLHGPNVPKMLGIEGAPLVTGERGIEPVVARGNLKVISMAQLLGEPDAAVIWRGPVKIGVIRQFLGEVDWGDLDFLIIDLPPGTGDEPLTVAQLIPGARAVIVTTPQDVALMDSRRSVTFARKLGMNVLGIIENMADLDCPHCGGHIELFGTGGGERAAAELGVPFLGRLPVEPHIVRSGDSGVPFILARPDSPSSAAFGTIIHGILSAVRDTPRSTARSAATPKTRPTTIPPAASS